MLIAASHATYASAYRELGLAHYRKGNRPQAIAALERYLARDPRAKDAPRINTAIQYLRHYQLLRITALP